MLYNEEEENYDEIAFDEKSDTTIFIQTAKITKVTTVKHHRLK